MAEEIDLTLPHDDQTERAVLGSIFLDPSVSDVVLNILKPDDFFNQKHRIIYEAILELIEEGKEIDPLILINHLDAKGKLEKIGGKNYIALIGNDAAPPNVVETLAQQLKEKAIARNLILVAKNIIEKSKKIRDVNQLIEEAETQIFQLNEDRTVTLYYDIKDVIKETLHIINELSKKETIITGIPSGFYDIDRLTTGFHPGDLIIIAARPAMGKTSFALSILHNISVLEKRPAAFFSLEMSKEQIAMRLLSLETRIKLKDIRSGFLSPEKLQKLTEKAAEISKSPLFIDDTASISILDLRAKARRLKREKDIQLIVVDYLQLMRSHRRTENRQQEVAEISRGLKALAKELNIPVISLAQLSRQAEMRADKRPQLADLRESGCLTGDTLVVDAETGKLHKIKDMVGKQFYTLSMDENFKIKKSFVSKVFYSGKKKVYLLKTRSGREIKASANHPFYKLDGWYRLDQLKIGDKIATARKINTDYQDKLSDEEIILIAHLLGDGYILPKQPYHYTSQDLENIKIVAKTAKKLFGIDPKIVQQKNWYHVYLPSPYRLTHNKKHPITYWFDKLGIKRVRSYEKEIPSSIFSLSKDKLSLFIKHLWATDGSITYRKSKGKDQISIYYSTTSKKFAHQLQHLLLKFGIISVIRKNQKDNYRPNYNVYIYGKNNQKIFLNEIGCFGARGKHVNKILDILNEKSENPNIDTIPKETWRYIDKLRDISWREFSKKIGMSYCGTSLFKNSVSRKRLLKIANILNVAFLYKLANSDLFWDEIIEIEELGVEDVYDMTVEDTHNFVANDIVVHNSIEQDADLVMFIHRPEYYKKNPTPEEEGLAEIIIAKQRNGPTGVVNLAFIKEITRFENLAKTTSPIVEEKETEPHDTIESEFSDNLDFLNEEDIAEI
ncbi:replicative DNA helicase [Persephonella hydrogeniphila]|uniref:Replicative DNA helicase n=1 Tax=Persephonella hydrogeniphila TaxID=198703 RepID=A0A285NIH5_9AQUI|nr:replicative DNA helicase [Persephonella hydrogeniphila]SNZ08713.1 replicative DNA helicase [Persephonella hydrogeniphila]